MVNQNKCMIYVYIFYNKIFHHKYLSKIITNTINPFDYKNIEYYYMLMRTC